MRLRRNSFESEDAVVAELVLSTVNDGELYRQQVVPIITNLAKKMAKGQFDRSKAIKLMGYLADNGARKYAFEHGARTAGARMWHQQGLPSYFPAALRRKAAADMLDYYMEAIEEAAGEIKAKPARKRSASTSRKRVIPGGAQGSQTNRSRRNPGWSRGRFTMADLKRVVADKTGSPYFSRGSSRFFGGDKFYGPYLPAVSKESWARIGTIDGGAYFVQINRAGTKVKFMEPDGHIRSVADAYDREEASALARQLAKQGKVPNPRRRRR